jgi:hypothetical protein
MVHNSCRSEKTVYIKEKKKSTGNLKRYKYIKFILQKIQVSAEIGKIQELYAR